MIKTMIAKYRGMDCRTGHPIRPGDEIQYDTATRQAWIHERADERPFYTSPGRVSDHLVIGGQDYFRNKAGRCEDAPCCGCCTI
jgi:hypothetical protein